MNRNSEVAVIGMAGRFPGANTLEQHRHDLRNRAGSIVDVDKFDYDFFGMAQSEACALAPRLRKLFEVVHDAFEDAACVPEHVSSGRCAVFVGETSGEDGASFADRIAKQFALTGRARTVDAARASGVAVLHEAIDELDRGDADHVVVCGANLHASPFVAGLLLKPLARALEDGDPIHAVIRRPSLDERAAEASVPGILGVIEAVLQATRGKKGYVDGMVIDGAPAMTQAVGRGVTTRAKDGAVLVPLSARTEALLDEYRIALRDFLAIERPELADVGHTLSQGRRHREVRAAYVVCSLEQLIGVLSAPRRTRGVAAASDGARSELELAAARYLDGHPPDGPETGVPPAGSRIRLPARPFAKTACGEASLGDARRRGAAQERVSRVSAVSPGIPRAPEQEHYPLSSAQQRLWVLSQLEEGTIAYNSTMAFDVHGALDADRLSRALQGAVDRHEILRTVFIEVDGAPRQKILPVGTAMPFEVVDLRELGEQERPLRAIELVEADERTPCDLVAGPLLRMTVVRMGRERSVLIFTSHHIISDGWSSQVFARDLIALYEGTTPRPLSIQYKDYACWQLQSRSTHEAFAKSERYWLDKMSGELPVLQLQTDRPRPALQSFNGRALSFVWSKDVLAAIMRMCRAENATLYIFLVTAVKALLHRYTDQEDLIVGTATAGRTHSALEDQIGYYASTMGLRTTVSADDAFSEVLKRVRKTSLQAMEHSAYPFDQLVEKLGGTRDLSWPAVFNVTVVLQNTPIGHGALRTRTLTFEPFSFRRIASQFDLTFEFEQLDDQLRLTLTYNTDLFDEARVDRMARHLEVLAGDAVRRPEAKVKELELLGAAERAQLRSFRSEEADVEGTAVHHAIEAWAAREPERIAFISARSGKKVSFGVANRRANQLARCLRAEGVGSEDAVLLAVERGPELAIAILAIWKIGGVYVPLEPKEPKARVQALVDGSRARWVVARTRADVAEVDTVKVMALDEWDAAISRENPDDLDLPHRESNLAYTMFAPSAVGPSKRVAVDHRGMMNHLQGKIARLEITSESVVSQDASSASGNSIWQCFAAPMAGGVSVFDSERWHPAPWASARRKRRARQAPSDQGRAPRIRFFDRENLLHPDELVRKAAAYEVSILEVTPSYLAHLLDTRGEFEHWLPHLKWLVVSGEVVPASLARRWFECKPAVPMVTAYHANESSNDVMYNVMRRAPDRRIVPAGTALRSASVHVLDRHGNPQPIGLRGEVHVGDESPGQTGDEGCWSADGSLVLVGRRDEKVEVRGFRIDLGEVEFEIGQDPRVKAVRVLGRADARGRTELCAYVVADSGFDGAALKAHLSLRLPSYMVPAYIVELEAIPLTADTKWDLDTLRTIPVASERAVRAPASETERALQSVWREVLGENVEFGTEESFFELGGNSLSATRLVGKVHKALNVRVPLVELFKRPSIGAMAKYIEEKRPSRHESIPRAPDQTDYPLSFAQRRLWILSQLEEGSLAYHATMALELSGEVDTSALSRAFDTLVERHESWRTVFVEVDGVPRQKIVGARAAGITLRIVDVRAQVAPDADARHWVESEAAKPFDLAVGPLVRPTLIRVADGRSVLAITTHHIIGDGWSEQVYARELVSLYDAYAHGRENPLAPLNLQYKDYAAWQTEKQSRSEEFAKAESYWLSKLSGELPTLELPTDRPRPPIQTFNGATHEVRWPRALTEKLHGICRREGATLYMFLLAAVKVLLHRYSGQEDMIVGMPTAGRTHRDLENQVGFYVSTVVMRTTVRSEDPFQRVLGSVKNTVLEGMEHAMYPFDSLVEKLAIKRDLSRSAIFDVMVILQNHDTVMGAEPTRAGALSFEPFAHRKVTIPFDMVLEFEEHPDWLSLRVGYNTDLFERARIERMASHLEAVLRRVAEDPAMPVKSIDILTESELSTLESFHRWSPVQESLSIAARFEKQVRATPDATALVWGQEKIRYRELNRRANRLAHELRSLGVGTDVVVGISAERSPWMVIGLLAILKAGGAYLPLDPNYPKTRLAYMLQQSGLSVLLTDRPSLARLPEHGGRTILLDEESPPGDEHDLPHSSHPEALAYVIYTSGSTGQPKGVAMHVGALDNLLAWQIALSNAREGTRTLQFPSFSFDVSFQDTLSTLHTGGTLVLSSDEQRMDAEQLLALLISERIERVFMPVVMLHQLAQRATAHGGRGLELREIYIGGETLRINEDVRALLRALPGCRLFNHYGPTETHVTTSWESPPRPDDIPDLPPIGRPAINVSAHVLDGDLRRVPIGVPGEVYHGGAQVARGYYRDPIRTAERFIPDPYGSPGSRMYRTGDVAHWQDGQLRFHGRDDGQVKLRGYRIELGEIESVLRRHPGVREAVVLAIGESADTKQLVAYVQGAGELPSAQTLHEALSRDLPEYMVPAHYVPVATWPLTPSGKIHRKGLQPPDVVAGRTMMMTGVERQAEASDLRTPVEKLVADVFAEVLDLPRVGAGDHFFLLGGHSLLATQVVSRLRNVLRVHLPLRVLFEAPTVRALAARIGAAGEAWRATAPALVRAERGEHLPLSFAQQRLWFMDRLEPGSTAYNIAFGLRLEGELDVDALRGAFEDLVGRHEVLRTVFPTHDSAPVQRICNAASLGSGDALVPMIDLTGLAQAEQEPRVRQVADAQVEEPFDLTRGPLLRTVLLRLGDSAHVLVGAMHHIVSDGWSMGILVRELAVYYEARLLGKRAELEPLPVQVADHAIWQRRWLEGSVLTKQLAYWKERLAGLAPLELPVDRPWAVSSIRAGARVPVVIAEPVAAALRSVARREGATSFMVLLAAFQAVLGRWCGQSDVAVGAAIAGRTQRELEGLIGFFVNTLVLRVDLAGNPTFTELLARVKDSTLGAYAHQETPFEKLVEEIAPPRALGRTPFFQVMFAMQNAPSPALKLGGMTFCDFGSLDMNQGAEKFDMTLDLQEDEGVIRGALQYQPALFDAVTVERLVARLLSVLESVARDASIRVADLPMLTEGERRLLARSNDTTQDYAAHARIAASFEAQAARVPERIAVADRTGVLTYEALNRRANQLAHHLRARGVGPDVPVGIRFERSIEQIIAVLGVLKAGGAYVPMDPSHPKARLEQIVAETGMRVVLSVPALREMDATSSSFADTNPEPVGSPDNLIYVLYTSGSTGRPKGVMVTERGLLNYVSWALEHYGAGGKGAPVHSPLAFDLTITSLFTPLLSGATLRLCDEEDGGAGLARCLTADADFDLVKLTPAHLTMLAHELKPQAVAGAARAMVIGGEALTAEHLAFFRAHAPKTRLINEYGPTETVVGCCVYEVPPGEIAPGPVAMGQPIANTQLHVLDGALAQVPIGTPGELYIGGAGVARGYLAQPGLTAERFVPDPFSAAPGARLYRTGDLVRHRSDGNLVFLGRIDHQIKIRGYRIELEEVESVLSAAPGVRTCAVIALARNMGTDPELVAFVCAEPGAGSVAAWFEYLREHLPRYMVPSRIELRDELPLTSNGKIDRRALAAFVPPIRPVQLDPSEAPRTALQQRLAGVFAQVLGVPHAHLHDDFFALGGHSLLAVRLASRIEDLLGRPISLSQIFRTPTVAGLASALEEGPAGERDPLLALRVTGTKPPIFFVHAIGGSAMAYRDLATALGDDQPFYGLQAAGVDGDEIPCTSVGVMAERYIAALRRIQPAGPYRLGGWSFGGVVAREMALRLMESGERVDALTVIDAWSPAFARRSDAEDEISLLHGLADELELAVDHAHLAGLSASERLPYLAQQAVRAGLLSSEAAERILERLFRVLNAHAGALRDYAPGPYEGPMTLIRANEPFTPESEARIVADPTCGWASENRQPVDVHVVPGHHYSIIRRPRVEAIAAILRRNTK